MHKVIAYHKYGMFFLFLSALDLALLICQILSANSSIYMILAFCLITIFTLCWSVNVFLKPFVRCWWNIIISIVLLILSLWLALFGVITLVIKFPVEQNPPALPMPMDKVQIAQEKIEHFCISGDNISQQDLRDSIRLFAKEFEIKSQTFSAKQHCVVSYQTRKAKYTDLQISTALSNLFCVADYKRRYKTMSMCSNYLGFNDSMIYDASFCHVKLGYVGYLNVQDSQRMYSYSLLSKNDSASIQKLIMNTVNAFPRKKWASLGLPNCVDSTTFHISQSKP